MTDNRSERNPGEILRQSEKTMMAAIDAALDVARRDAAEALNAIGYKHRQPNYDYFSYAALHILFLRHCGADAETAKGGNPKRGARILHIGKKITQYWSQEDGGQSLETGQVRPDMTEEDEKDRADLIQAAQDLALKTVLRALVDQASAADPGLRDRLTETVEARIARLDSQSEQSEAFAEWTRTAIAHLIRPPAT